jgi:BirA family transcriptional regulator, biotin operon repressor / biotin---[acetyl-CoA-carboxylase] ligase
VAQSLAPEVVLPLLRGRFGHPYRYAERCASTQRMLTPDDPEGAVACTDEQTEGRGRLGRSWHAPARTSVLVSVLLTPAVEASRLPELSVVGGRAVADAIAAETGLGPSLKFPNDVLVEGKKVAGILAEASEGRVVLGIGVNVNQDAGQLPSETQTPATSLKVETGRELDRAPLLASILERLEAAYGTWLREVQSAAPVSRRVLG